MMSAGADDAVFYNPRSDVGAGSTHPPRLGHVHGHTVGAGVLHLDIGVPPVSLSDTQRPVDVIARVGARRGQALGDRLQVLDLKAYVMDAAPALAALDPRDVVVLEVEDREVDVPIAQVVTPGARAVDLADLLHAEHVDVELRGSVNILGRQRDVLDLGHGDLLSVWVRSPVIVTPRVRQNGRKNQNAAAGGGAARATVRADRAPGTRVASRFPNSGALG